MTDAIGSLDDYWVRGFPNVEGWLSDRLLQTLQMLDALQRRSAIVGGVGEIGVFHGKFLIALAHIAARGAAVAAIDVFEDQDRNLDGAGVGSLQRLQENIGMYAPVDRAYKYYKADSIALTSADKHRIVEECGLFRLFSVDGCHTAEHTYNDLLTAQEFISPGGVMILDDYMQPHWPGVTEAAHLFYSRGVPRVKAFLYMDHKLFFVGYGWYELFFRTFAEAYGPRGDVRLATMFGSPVVTVYP